MFFDEHPEFLETSSTAATVMRLNLRHAAIIEENRKVLRGARVLDIASHDGRWSFAALQAGAASVTGVEGREYLVAHANETFAAKGVDPSRYNFIAGDAHDVLTEGVGQYDVVMCLGFLYHTLRYVELFSGIRATGARYVIIDTRVTPTKNAIISVFSNPVERESMAVEDRFSYGGKALVGRPSMAALQEMLDVYGYEIASQTDWSRVLGKVSRSEGVAQKYREGGRVTLVAESRD
jgi:hypothetical protein